MQNLPSLVAQNTAIKSTSAPAAAQKSEEQGVSFKQVLSQQVEQESPKKQVDDKAAQTLKTDGANLGQDKEDLPETNTSQHQGRPEAEISVTKGVVENPIIEDLSGDALSNKEKQVLLAAQVGTNPKLVEVPSEGVSIDASGITSDSQKAPMADIALAASPVNVTADSRSNRKVNGANLAQEKPVDLSGKDLPSKSELPITAEAENGQKLNNAAPKSNGGAEKSLPFNSQLTSQLAAESTRDLVKEPSVSQVVSATSIAGLQAAKFTSAAAPVSAITQPGSSNEINVYPGKAGWNAAISQKVVWMVGATEQSATLTLNPPDLGPLQVVINVNNEKADATFISDNPEVRKALENGMTTLRNAMDQSGVQLGQTNVNTGKQQQAFEQAAREQLAQQSSANNGSPQSEESSTHATVKPQVNNGLVDIFA